MPEFEHVFKQRGPLGLNLTESPTGYAALKEPGDGQAADFGLNKGDCIIKIGQRSVAGLPYNDVIGLLVKGRRPLSIVFARPSNAEDDIKYHGTTGRGGIGVSPNMIHSSQVRARQVTGAQRPVASATQSAEERPTPRSRRQPLATAGAAAFVGAVSQGQPQYPRRDIRQQPLVPQRGYTGFTAPSSHVAPPVIPRRTPEVAEPAKDTNLAIPPRRRGNSAVSIPPRRKSNESERVGVNPAIPPRRRGNSALSRPATNAKIPEKVPPRKVNNLANDSAPRNQLPSASEAGPMIPPPRRQKQESTIDKIVPPRRQRKAINEDVPVIPHRRQGSKLGRQGADNFGASNLNGEQQGRDKEKERQQSQEEAKMAEMLRQEEEQRRQDEARMAEIHRQEEQQRRQEEARIAEIRRLEAEQRRQEEARIAEELREAEEQRRREEARIAEERRLEEERRRAEEARKRQEQVEAENKKRSMYYGGLQRQAKPVLEKSKPSLKVRPTVKAKAARKNIVVKTVDVSSSSANSYYADVNGISNIRPKPKVVPKPAKQDIEKEKPSKTEEPKGPKKPHGAWESSRNTAQSKAYYGGG